MRHARGSTRPSTSVHGPCTKHPLFANPRLSSCGTTGMLVRALGVHAPLHQPNGDSTHLLRSVFGGKANVTTAGALVDALGIAMNPEQNATASVGLAREKPQGSWLLLSRFSEGKAGCAVVWGRAAGVHKVVASCIHRRLLGWPGSSRRAAGSCCSWGCKDEACCGSVGLCLP